MAVCNQATDEIDAEIEGTAVTGVLNLRNVLELVGDSFNDGAFAQEQFVTERHQSVLHVGLEASDELNAVLKQLLEHRLRQIAFVAEQLAKQPLGQLGQQLDIGTMSGRQTASKQFAAVVDDQVQLEAEAPATRTAPACRQPSKDFVLMNTTIITDGDEGRVDEAHPPTASKQTEQVGAQEREDTRHQLDEARVAHQVRELSTQIDLDVLGVVGFERPVLALVEMDQDRHEFALA